VSSPPRSRERPRRVTMFVLNDMRLDSRVRREARTLAASGYEVVVYAVLTDATASVASERVDGYSIMRVPMLMRPSGDAPRVAGSLSSPTARSVAIRLAVRAFDGTRHFFGGSVHVLASWQLRWRSWARRVAAQVTEGDVWHAHDLPTLSLAVDCKRRFGGVVVYDSHEIFTEAGAIARLPRSVRAGIRWSERRLAKQADAVITVNESVAGVLGEQLGRPDVQVVHNCAEPPRGQRSLLREVADVAADDPLILYHGSLTVGRGLELLVAAMTDDRLGRAHLVMMGYGSLRDRLELLAGDPAVAGRVHLLPPVPPDELTAWVAGADVAAMPIEPGTLNHRLSSPNKLFESIAAGVPVVGPAFVEFRRVVERNAEGPLGVLHRDHSPRAIADALCSVLMAGQSARRAMRSRCLRAAARRWRWGREAAGLLAVYAGLPEHEPGSSRAAASGRGIVLAPADRP
jgi:glycosyltransferase involved in cell wall biosynthesis